ncbi:hypothetical protein ACFVZW_18520 [Streptomyces sp. NPDC059567]|uniref:hypothetical protein n=1 Tax=Streptomyces sp. NPDC059567 TaxID=3346867 RepID=UPI0036A8B33F
MTSEVVVVAGAPSPHAQLMVSSSLPGSVSRAVYRFSSPAWTTSVRPPASGTASVLSIVTVGSTLATVIAASRQVVVSSSLPQTFTVKVPVVTEDEVAAEGEGGVGTVVLQRQLAG